MENKSVPDAAIVTVASAAKVIASPESVTVPPSEGVTTSVFTAPLSYVNVREPSDDGVAPEVQTWVSSAAQTEHMAKTVNIVLIFLFIVTLPSLQLHRSIKLIDPRTIEAARRLTLRIGP